jgi:Zn-dependent protease
MEMLTTDVLLDGLAWYIVFLFSTTVHEAAHAFTAMKLGDKTAYYGGQVTLDPIPHIRREPLGTVVVPILSFYLSGWMIGWASTPYDPAWAGRYPRRSAWMSLAGPASNLLLVLFSVVLIRIGITAGVFIEPDSINFTRMVVAADQSGLFAGAATILSVMFTLNLLLFVFNLLPFPPLDGSGAIPLILKKKYALRYMNFIDRSGFGFFGLFIAWNVFGRLFAPIHLMAVNLLYPGTGYH